MVAVAEKGNECHKKESSEDAETTLWKLSRDESCGERKSDENGKERLLPSSFFGYPTYTDVIAVIVSATVPTCNVQHAEGEIEREIRGWKGTKSWGLARIGGAP